MRFSKQDEEILRLLSDGKEWLGLDMVEASKHIKRGSVYVRLHRLEDAGLVQSRRQLWTERDFGIPRRLYWLRDES